MKTTVKNSVLAFSDIDQTMVDGFLMFPVCGALETDGLITKAENQRIQEVLAAYEEGSIDYNTFVFDALKAALSAVQGKLPLNVQSSVNAYLGEELDWFGWVQPTFEDIEVHGGALTIVSAEPDFVTKAVARLFSARYFTTTIALENDGTYSGELDAILASEVKGKLVNQQLKESNASDSVYVFGDSVGDIGMLNHASPLSNAYCVRPSTELREHAMRVGMTIVEDPNIQQSLCTI